MQTDARQNILQRLKIIEGHLKKVRAMVEDGCYCPEIIQQSTAVQNSLRKVDEILLEGHLKDCVRKAIKSSGGEKEIQELLVAFSKR